MATLTEIQNGDSLEFQTGIPDYLEPIESPPFSVLGKLLYFRIFISESDEVYIKASMHHEFTEYEGRSFLFDFDVVLDVENNLSLGKGTLKMKFNTSFLEFWQYLNIELRSKLPSYYRTGNIIKFRFRFYLPSEPVLMFQPKSHDKSVQTPSYIHKCIQMDAISRDFSKLLEEDSNHDVEFVCGDQTLKAHKNILSCRSSVFASMFQTDMVEGNTGRVNIVDMNATLFQQFLKYLYTGNLPEMMFSEALQLYSAGDKYNISVLKRHCAEFLTDSLSPENACNILIVADRHKDADFKRSIMEYIMEEKIPYTGENWADFCKENPMLANEILNLLF